MYFSPVFCSGFFLTINPSLVNDYYLISLPFQSLSFEHVSDIVFHISLPLVAAATFKFSSTIIRS